MLARKNAHVRDSFIDFVDEGHIYTLSLNGKDSIHPTSTTTMIHQFFGHFDASGIVKKMLEKPQHTLDKKYQGKTADEIKKMWSEGGRIASELGTKMHLDIERYLNKEKVEDPDTKEFKMFLEFWEDFLTNNPGCKIYRTEWLVYDEDIPLSGSIDCTVITPEGKYILIDWKRSKEIKMNNRWQRGKGPCSDLDDCNYNHYTLQLNVYRHILETKYGGTVEEMALAVFHPDYDGYSTYPIDRREDLIEKIWSEISSH